MAFQTYTPSTNVWWDIVGTPLYLIGGNGDVYTYDNQVLSTSASNPSGYTQQGFQGKVLDNLAYLKTHRLLDIGSYTKVASGPPSYSGTTWGGNTMGVWQNNTNSLGDPAWFELGAEALPDGVTLTSVAVQITGSQTDTNLPNDMPAVSLWKVSAAGAATQLGSTTTDATAVLATYKAAHSLSVSAPANTTVNRSLYTYWLQVVPEAGTNSNAGMTVNTPSVSFSVS